jgi:hypothetical protein
MPLCENIIMASGFLVNDLSFLFKRIIFCVVFGNACVCTVSPIKQISTIICERSKPSKFSGLFTGLALLYNLSARSTLYARLLHSRIINSSHLSTISQVCCCCKCNMGATRRKFTRWPSAINFCSNCCSPGSSFAAG